MGRNSIHATQRGNNLRVTWLVHDHALARLWVDVGARTTWHDSVRIGKVLYVLIHSQWCLVCACAVALHRNVHL